MPRYIFLKIKNHRRTSSGKEMSNWFCQGVDVIVSRGGRKERVGSSARVDRVKDLEMGDISGSSASDSARARAVFALPEDARVHGGERLPGIV